MGGQQQLGATAVLGGGAHLRMLAGLHEGANGVEGTGAAGVQVGPVVGVQDLHEVHALGLGAEGRGGGSAGAAPRHPPGTPRHPLALTVMSLPAQLHSSLHSTGAGQ